MMAGYLLGAQWRGILGFLDRFQLVAAAVIVALVAWYVVAKVRAARHASLS